MISPIRRLRRTAWEAQRPTWGAAKPALISAALDRALVRNPGGWFVIGASREIRADRAFGRIVAGHEVVAWRDEQGVLRAGPGACPHLGAALCSAPVRAGRLVCRWHGLAIGAEGRAGWQPFPAHDDGVLAWVRIDAVGEPATEAPALGPRPPAGSLDAVATMIGRCEPRDVLANRLDPWHGVWLHPYSFASLRVLSTPTAGDDRFLVEVTFAVTRQLGVPVRAAFSCPDARTITMEIVEGEGTGTVVETHATPLRPGPDGRPRTAVIEAIVAHSDRPGFAGARHVAAALRPLITSAARRLWRDDIAYAERRYELRSRAPSTTAAASTAPPIVPATPSRSPSSTAASTAAVSGSSNASSAPTPAGDVRSPRKNAE